MNAESEINQLNILKSVDEDIFSLNVPMNDILIV